MAGFKYNLPPKEEQEERYDVSTGLRRRGNYVLDVAGLAVGSYVPSFTPIAADLKAKTAKIVVNVLVKENVGATDTKVKIAKGSYVVMGTILGNGTKGATARALNALMDEVAGKSEQKVIQTVALRSMMKAKYTTHNIGHFGLAFDYYTHFTSPIRRYPDTMVHRLLTRYEQGGHSANQDYIEELCEHSSDMEQVAQNAERDSIKYKMVEFMGDHLGECYDAHISGIQSYGIYAEIDENHCEGMIPMRDLDDDYYEFDEKNYCLVGRRRHHKYQLGDPIRIQVANANLERKQLDFTLADDQEDKMPTRALLNTKSGRPTKARRRRR